MENKENKENKENNNSDRKRHIDLVAEESFTRWSNTFTVIKKKEVKTWQAVAVMAFMAGTASTIIWTSNFGWNIRSNAANENAALSLSTTKTTASAGEVIPVTINLNTGGANVVVTRAVIRYNKKFVSATAADVSLTGSVFESGNTCAFPADYSEVALRGKTCRIIKDDPVNGTLSITLAMPSSSAAVSPGAPINTTSGLVAKINFHAVATVTDSLKAMGIQYYAVGNYTASNVIADDGNGTDILTSVAQKSTITYGDLNEDRQVNGADLSILRANYGNTESSNLNNINGDGLINGSDLSIMKANFGKLY